jgi:hypothetical protein
MSRNMKLNFALTTIFWLLMVLNLTAKAQVTFTDATAKVGLGDVTMERTDSAAGTWGDYDNDGDVDLLIFTDTSDIRELYRNEGDGRFVNVTQTVGITDISFGATTAIFGDFDNNGDGTFTDVSKEAGIGGTNSGTVNFVDYDNDGDLDIFTGASVPVEGIHKSSGGLIVLYRNNGTQNHWLKLKLVGTKSNRDAIGARVTVITGGLSMLREVVGSSGGHMGNKQDRLPVHFGLGQNTKADMIEIRWPSGITQRLQNINANQTLTITEPAEDFSNVFFLPLETGLNMISLPLKPRVPYTARLFAEMLSATVVIELDEARQRFVGFTLDAPDDGFPIEGGKRYVVNIPESRVVAFTGAAWTNQPPVEAAPEVRDFGYPTQSDGAWAFVVSGRFEDNSKDGYLVTVRNTRINTLATDVVRSGYFAAAFADLNRKSVVQAGDRLEVTVEPALSETKGQSDRLSYFTVTDEAIHQAFLPITLKNVEIPCQSLLLQNYPNPFNPETWIPYQLREPADVVIRIYSSSGQLVRTLNLGQRATGFYLGRNRAAY